MSKKNGGKAAGKNPKQEDDDNKSVKVKYISSPVMVEAKNPSQFKEIVQHFTGRTPNKTSFGGYSNANTNTMAATTTTRDAGCQFFAYGASTMNSLVGIDGYSWEEIAEWNRDR